MPERTNPALWEQSKKIALEKQGGKWSARVAQMAVRIYKEKGGGYKGAKSSSNPLVKWSKEKWDYAGEKDKSRYLPEKVRKAMSSSLKKKENIKKGSKKGKNIPYSKELNELMKKKNIY